jgi:hypothetical protein
MEHEVSIFMNALRVAVPTMPDPRLEVELVPRLAETARVAALEAETGAARGRATGRKGARGGRARPRLALLARVGIAVALLPLVLTGLAFAGVTVPQAARSAFDSVGIVLPNQPSDPGSQAGEGGNGLHIQGAPSTVEPPGGLSIVAPRARHHGRALGHDAAQHAKKGGSAKAAPKRNAYGQNGTPPARGQSKSSESSAGGNAGGQSAAHAQEHARELTPTAPVKSNGKPG